jgi:acyl carrier protein
VLRERLQASLPEYMVPLAFVRLERLPLTPNGKVDRKALPAPADSDRCGQEEYVAPRNDTEQALADIWCKVLGLARVGIHDDFFGLGGHSLTATQVVSRVREVLGVEIALRALFERPTVAQLAEAVALLADTSLPDGEVDVAAMSDEQVEAMLLRLSYSQSQQ